MAAAQRKDPLLTFSNIDYEADCKTRRVKPIQWIY